MAVYMTTLGKYPGMTTEAWRLVAVLQVMKRFESHEGAAEWYERHGLALPSNCLVDGNGPLGLDHTEDPNRDLGEWDDLYQSRVSEYPTFLICKKLYVELSEPKVITRDDFHDVFGRVPPTRTPSAHVPGDVRKLLAAMGISISVLDPDGLKASLAAYPTSKTAAPRRAPRPTVRPGGTAPGSCGPPAGGCGPPKPGPGRKGGC